MKKMGTVTIVGESGHKYEFALYPIDSHFEEGHAGVYFISARNDEEKAHHSHKKVFIGETDDLSNAVAEHPKKACFEKEGANCISIHPTPSTEARERIVQDLLAHYNTTCNGE